MAVTLTVCSGDVKVPPITLDSPRIVIGRGSSCELVLPDPSVSQRHASIRQRGSEYIVLDEGSTNGTFVGPVKLAPGAPRVLRTADLVRVGRIWLKVSIQPAQASKNPAELTREIALGLIAGALELDGQPSCPRVLATAGPDVGAELLLAEFNRGYTIGRQSGSDLVLSDEDVSRRHLQVERRGARILVTELGSKNGACLDGKPLETEAVWLTAQPLEIGNTVLNLDDPISETLSEINAAGDELIDDSVEPPNAETGAEAALGPSSRRSETAPPNSSPSPLSDRAAARVAQPPKGRSSMPSKGRSWGSADLAIATLALTVLGLSAAGLVWLFGQ